jgi:hypothetical protein
LSFSTLGSAEAGVAASATVEIAVAKTVIPTRRVIRIPFDCHRTHKLLPAKAHVQAQATGCATRSSSPSRHPAPGRRVRPRSRSSMSVLYPSSLRTAYAHRPCQTGDRRAVSHQSLTACALKESGATSRTIMSTALATPAPPWIRSSYLGRASFQGVQLTTLMFQSWNR